MALSATSIAARETTVPLPDHRLSSREAEGIAGAAP